MDKQPGPTVPHRNYIQYSLINHNGKEYKKNVWICYNWITVTNCSKNLHNIVNQLYFNYKKWIMSPFQEWPSWLSYVNSSSSVVLYLSSLFMSFVAQFCSVIQSCLTLCDPMDCSTPGFPVRHQLQELARTQCPSSRWCHPTISSSVVPFSFCLQSFPTSRYFPVSQFFTSGGQSIGASASASVLPMNIQYWFPLELNG